MVEFSTVAVVVLISLEFGYFLKAVLYSLSSKLLLRRIHPLVPSRLYGICTTRDIDFFLNHINNARYLRAMDFGRLDHFIRAGVYSAMLKSNAKILVAASTVRYRKPVYLFMLYRLQSQIVYWDNKNLYYRQDFITVHDNFLRTTAYVKLAILGSTPEEVLGAAITEDLPSRPELSNDLQSWIQYNEQNSDNLKKVQQD